MLAMWFGAEAAYAQSWSGRWSAACVNVETDELRIGLQA